MEIAYFVHCYPPAKGGLEFLSQEIVDVLQNAGHNVKVITGKGLSLDSYKTIDDWIEEKQSHTNIIRLSLRTNLQKLANKVLQKLIFISGTFSPWYFGPILTENTLAKQLSNTQLIISAGMPTLSFYQGYQWAKKLRVPLIAIPVYHDVSYYNNSLAFQSVFNYAQVVICQSPLEQKLLSKNYKNIKNKIKKIAYCPYSKIDWQRATQLAKQKQTLIKKKINTNQTINIGYVGQITLRKRLIELIHWLKRQPQNQSPIKLILAGASTNSSTLIEREIKKTNLNTKIIYNFSDQDKLKIYSDIDLFINPSTEESLGIVNFEALSYGLPVAVPSETAFFSLSGLEKLLIQFNYSKNITELLQASKQVQWQEYKMIQYTKKEFAKRIQAVVKS